MQVAFETVDRFLDVGIVFAEDWAVAGEQPLDVACLDALERLDEVGDAAAVMGVDRADAAVTKNVVTREKQVAHTQRQLPVGVARRVPDFELQLADRDRVAVVHQVFDRDGRHVEVDVLGSDLGERGELVARFEIFRSERVAGDRRFENLLCFG